MIGVWNVNDPFETMLRLSPPLSCNTKPAPESPETVPPMVYASVVQATCTFVTLAVAVPLALVTLQIWVGLEGGVETATS